MSRRSPLFALALCTAVALPLSACSSKEKETPDWAKPSPAASSAADVSASGSPGAIPATTAPGATGRPATSAAPAPPATATSSRPSSKAAGSSRIGTPAGATKVTGGITSYGKRYATITSPTGNIGCDFAPDGSAGCGVQNWIKDGLYPSQGGNHKWWLSFDGGRPTVGLKGDAPWFVQGGAQSVPYGQTVYSGNVVCSSAFEAMICWDHTTGHGAFMSRDGYKPF